MNVKKIRKITCNMVLLEISGSSRKGNLKDYNKLMGVRNPWLKNFDISSKIYRVRLSLNHCES